MICSYGKLDHCSPPFIQFCMTDGGPRKPFHCQADIKVFQCEMLRQRSIQHLQWATPPNELITIRQLGCSADSEVVLFWD